MLGITQTKLFEFFWRQFMTDLNITPPQRTKRIKKGEKLRSAEKVERIPVKVIPSENILRKPESESPLHQKYKQLKIFSAKISCPRFAKKLLAQISVNVLVMALRHS